MNSETKHAENANSLSIDSDHAPEDIVEALQAIVWDVDIFLSNWLGRLDQSFQTCDPPTTPDKVLQKRYDEFQKKNIVWEAKRNSEERRIQEQVQQLTEAWLRLEDEQRKFLQMKDLQQHAGNQRDSTSGRATQPEPLTSGALRPINKPESSPPSRTPDAAIRQFQQLRREIESSRTSDDRSGEANDLGHSCLGDRR